MRKIIVGIFLILMFVTLVAFRCQKDGEILIGDSMKNTNVQNTPYLCLNTLSAYKINDKYTVIIEKNGKVQKIVEFSKDRKTLQVQELELIEDGGMEQYLDMSLKQLSAELGKEHVDIGNGFFIPSYITANGYMICFEIQNEKVSSIIKYDLLSGLIIEEI